MTRGVPGAADDSFLDVWLVDAGDRTHDRAALRARARLVLRAVCAGYLGCVPEAVPLARHCLTCGARDHGKPYLATPERRPHISLSHSGGRVAVAVCGVPVGVDTERVRDGVPWERLRPLVLHPDEPVPGADAARWFERWSVKEAVVKMTGDGLALPLARVTVGPAGADGWHPAHAPGRTAWVRGLATADGHAAAVAVARPVAAPRIRHRNLTDLMAAPGPYQEMTP